MVKPPLAAEKPKATDEALIAKLRKIRAQGERGNAIALAIENKVKPEDVPFLDGYAEHLALNGIKFSTA